MTFDAVIQMHALLTVWLTPHMKTLRRGSFARNSLTFWCLTRKCFFLSLLSPLDICGTLDMFFALMLATNTSRITPPCCTFARKITEYLFTLPSLRDRPVQRDLTRAKKNSQKLQVTIDRRETPSVSHRSWLATELLLKMARTTISYLQTARAIETLRIRELRLGTVSNHAEQISLASSPSYNYY